MHIVQANSAVVLLAVDQRFTMLDLDHLVVFDRAIGEHIKCPIIEDVAVLINLDKRDAFVTHCAFDHHLKMRDVRIDGASHESGLSSQRDRKRIQWIVYYAERRGFGLLAEFACGRILAFGQAVDPVVEKDDVDVEIPPDRVNQMVPADRQCVAVARDDPDRQLGIRGLDAGCNRGRAPVNAVKPVGIHVIRKAARAADAGDEYNILPLEAELGAYLLPSGTRWPEQGIWPASTSQAVRDSTPERVFGRTGRGYRQSS